MTAYTQGAKRRIKRGKGGRPKKPGPRVASSGRLSRAADDLEAPTLLARCRAMGWAPTRENLHAARDHRLAWWAGQMRVRQERREGDGLSAAMYAALTAFFELGYQHGRALDSPRQWPAPSLYGAVTGKAPREMPPETADRIRAEYDAALAALDAEGRRARLCVLMACAGHAVSLSHLRRGCEALAVHFRIELDD